MICSQENKIFPVTYRVSKINRVSQKYPIFVYHLLMKRKCDDTVMAAVENKNSVIRAFLGEDVRCNVGYTKSKYVLTEAGKAVFGGAGKSFILDYETPRAVVLVSDKERRFTVSRRCFVLMFREVKSRGKNSEQDG